MDSPRTEGADGVIALAENRYGKSRVRLVQVKRRGDRNDFREWTVEILFTGDFESCFVEGNTRNIRPTDTMKNTVYSRARESSWYPGEGFWGCRRRRNRIQNLQ